MIENQLLPAYAADGFSAAAIYVGEMVGYGQLIARHYDQSFPLAYDLESEVLDEFRVFGHVFPLRLVLDREGIVVFIATGEENDPCGKKEPGCPCEGRGELCLTRDAIEEALAR